MPAAECYGCDFGFLTPDKTDIPLRMGSHVNNCHEARKHMETFNENTQEWGYKGHIFRFKWTPELNSRLVYIFSCKDSLYAMAAVPLEATMEPTLENAQATGRKYLHHWVDNFGFLTESDYADRRRKVTSSARRTAPVPKVIPTGPHCRKCLKIDEGDLVDAPDGEGQLCMVHFIEAMR